MAGRLPIRRKPKIITQSKYIANFVVSEGITKLRNPKYEFIWFEYCLFNFYFSSLE